MDGIVFLSHTYDKLESDRSNGSRLSAEVSARKTRTNVKIWIAQGEKLSNASGCARRVSLLCMKSFGYSGSAAGVWD